MISIKTFLKYVVMKYSKKGYSTGFSWIFGLVSLFGLGVMYITFNYVFTAHLVPVMKAQANASNVDAATVAEINAGIDRYMMYFHALPYILFFIVVIFMFLASVRKEQNEGLY